MSDIFTTIVTVSSPFLAGGAAALWARANKQRDELIKLNRENAKLGSDFTNLEKRFDERDKSHAQSESDCKEQIAAVRQDMQVLSLNNELDKQYIVVLQNTLHENNIEIPPRPKLNLKRRSTDE